jgi:sulfur carrier protein
MMGRIKVNDEVQEVKLPLTLLELMTVNKVLQPDMLSIQLNGEFIEKEAYGATMVKEGDEVDFLYFMGGGR